MAARQERTKVAVGEVRPSQLLWTYGPGALVDLPNMSVVTMGIDAWERDRCLPVEEHRLLAAVRRRLGPQVESMRIPPIQTKDDVSPLSAEALIGVPVRPFPRFLRCVYCGLLSEYDAGLFKIKDNAYRPERTQFVHRGCKGSSGDKPARDADAVAARFLLACRNGHLDDFPWHYYVHSGQSTCRGSLRFFESGASLQTENLWVKCDQCGASRSMAQAFGTAGEQNLPRCRGRHAHLDDRWDEDCDDPAKAVLLGATNSWFPIKLSALAIPVGASPLQQLLLDGAEYFDDAESEAEVKGTLKALKRSGGLPGIENFEAAEIWAAIEAKRAGDDGDDDSQADIKGPEWRVLTDPNPPSDWPDFLSEKVDTPPRFKDAFSRVLLLPRLREVNALLGFTRVEAPEEDAAEEDRTPMAQLSRGAADWVPAGEVRGEGIFIQFDEEALATWSKRDSVIARQELLLRGHRGWRMSRQLTPDTNFAGVRYAMIHTLSHLLIRELALECGYNAASIRERIYARVDGEDKQAGLLIYTAAADSDGTLGGLVDLGKPESFGRLLRQALHRASICSSDPLCADHNPAKDRSLHAAACHACSFVSETSCELQNRYLDRALVIPTLECVDAAFFSPQTPSS